MYTKQAGMEIEDTHYWAYSENERRAVETYSSKAANANVGLLEHRDGAHLSFLPSLDSRAIHGEHDHEGNDGHDNIHLATGPLPMRNRQARTPRRKKHCARRAS